MKINILYTNTPWPIDLAWLLLPCILDSSMADASTFLPKDRAKELRENWIIMFSLKDNFDACHIVTGS